MLVVSRRSQPRFRNREDPFRDSFRLSTLNSQTFGILQRNRSPGNLIDRPSAANRCPGSGTARILFVIPSGKPAARSGCWPTCQGFFIPCHRDHHCRCPIVMFFPAIHFLCPAILNALAVISGSRFFGQHYFPEKSAASRPDLEPLPVILIAARW